jgi:topoisomerase IA-like protein
MVRKGKYGLYMTWGKSKKSLAYLGNRPLENIKITDINFS